jgi:hypothetical protein
VRYIFQVTGGIPCLLLADRFFLADFLSLRCQEEKIISVC